MWILILILILIRILFFIKVMGIRNQNGLWTLQGSILSVYTALHGTISPLKLLDFECNRDPHPAFHSNADLPALKNNVDACGSGSANLETQNFALFFIEL